MHLECTADSDTVSASQVSSVQPVTDKSLEALNEAKPRTSHLWDLNLVHCSGSSASSTTRE